jgi:hypothetical protein
MLVSIILVLVLIPVATFLFFVAVMRSARMETAANRYYGQPFSRRQEIKNQMAARGRQLLPLFRLFALLPPSVPNVRFRGMDTPLTATDKSSMRRAAEYVPDSKDVFVATQMKCGTTWMQQLTYEVLMRGLGDFSDAGHGHLYATSPWIEATFGVPMGDAPRLGPEGIRLIKTHLPADRCPYSPHARYIYVTRHPVACFASTVDFFRLLGGVLCPPREWLLDWYLSDRMWWRSWPEHVDGWWRWAQQYPNVLFVHYETMLADLPGTISQVAAFLNVTLDAAQHAEVLRKSGFAFMKAHEERFEMAPPSLLSELATQSFMPGGTRDREREGVSEERQRILLFCRERLENGAYPLQRFYAL